MFLLSPFKCVFRGDASGEMKKWMSKMRGLLRTDSDKNVCDSDVVVVVALCPS